MPEPVRNPAALAGDRLEMLKYLEGHASFPPSNFKIYSNNGGKKTQPPKEGSKQRAKSYWRLWSYKVQSEERSAPVSRKGTEGVLKITQIPVLRAQERPSPGPRLQTSAEL